MLKVLLAGGGTAGHVNPALAIAEIIKEHHPDAEFLFAGTPFGIEANLIPKAGYNFAPIKIRGFQRQINLENIVRNFQAVGYLAMSGSRAKKIIKDFSPDLVIGTGGYVSGPVVRKAAKMGIKTAIHEANAFAGVTTKLLSKDVDKIMLTVRETKNLDESVKDKTTVTGLPVRKAFATVSKSEARKQLGIPENATVILSAGGSLGARTINNNVAKLLKWYQENNIDVYHIHSYGTYKDYENYIEKLENDGVKVKDNPRLQISSYINMPLCMSACDLIISRCGASTLVEIEAVGRGSILIPSPMVAENHQYHNGMVLEKAGAGIVIEEKNLDEKKFISEVEKLINNPQKMEEFSQNAKKLHIADTHDRIYGVIKSLL
ncbi:MAG: undecaprenyldiphospho-muramoylpentapeptide beta-N-acetylglucosaminyltransferase [Oscillospiraceae bacterium]|nr:undecaprenyldiphospho-muramoylpentapeptide beta-N-acetylglucosaminyltransferase [Oscillospiraceae bacterium]